MLALILALALQSPNSSSVELNPSDPQGTNYSVILKCLQLTPWWYTNTVGPHGGCRIYYTPGKYYIAKPLQIPNGITDVYFKGVTLIPCADMFYIIGLGTLGPAPGATIHDLVIPENLKPCGTFVPPLKQTARFF